MVLPQAVGGKAQISCQEESSDERGRYPFSPGGWEGENSFMWSTGRMKEFIRPSHGQGLWRMSVSSMLDTTDMLCTA